jgi:hypothetical protein
MTQDRAAAVTTAILQILAGNSTKRAEVEAVLRWEFDDAARQATSEIRCVDE